MKAPTYTLQLTIERRKRDEQASGYLLVPDGTETATVDLYLDLDAILRRLGAKAMRAKSGRAQMARGVIVARVRHKTRERTRPAPVLESR